MPPFAISKRPIFWRIAPVNAPGSCPKSSLSRRVSGKRAAVHRDERPRLARARVVDRLRHELLPGPRLPTDQDGHVGLGDLPDEAEDLPHLAALPDDVPERVLLLDLLPQARQERRLAARFDPPSDAQDQFLVVARLGQVVERSPADRLDRGVDRGVAGHHQDRQVGVDLPDGREERDAVQPLHAQVGEDEVERLRAEPVEGGVRALGAVHLEPLVAEEGPDADAKRLVVVHDQDLAFESHGLLLCPPLPYAASAGNVTVKRAPRPGSLSPNAPRGVMQ